MKNLVKSRPRIAVYPGSFDLLTNGHLDLITRAQQVFDQVIVAVGANDAKSSMFSVEERLAVLREVTTEMDNVDVVELMGLTVEFAAKCEAQFIIRGLRAISDFEFELQLALVNHKLNASIETIFLAADPKNIFLSSRVVKEVWRHGGDVSDFVPTAVFRLLTEKRDELLKQLG